MILGHWILIPQFPFKPHSVLWIGFTELFGLSKSWFSWVKYSCQKLTNYFISFISLRKVDKLKGQFLGNVSFCIARRNRMQTQCTYQSFAKAVLNRFNSKYIKNINELPFRIYIAQIWALPVSKCIAWKVDSWINSKQCASIYHLILTTKPFFILFITF